jgi:hypothetical protein
LHLRRHWLRRCRDRPPTRSPPLNVPYLGARRLSIDGLCEERAAGSRAAAGAEAISHPAGHSSRNSASDVSMPEPATHNAPPLLLCIVCDLWPHCMCVVVALAEQWAGEGGAQAAGRNF